MFRILLLCLFLSASLLNAQSFSFQSDRGGVSMQIEDGSKINVNPVDEIVVRLEKLEAVYNSKLNKVDQKKASQIIEEIYNLLALMPDDVKVTISSTESSQTTEANVNINVQFSEEQFSEEPAPKVEKVTKTAMSKAEFQQLKANVDEESFADDQLSVVRIAARSKYFSIGQLVELLSLFSFSEDKIEVVEIVYPKVVDPDNAHNLLKAFTYSDDKAKVERIINK